MKEQSIIETISKEREKLDVLIESLAVLPVSREASLVKTNLQEARMFLGELGLMTGATDKYDHTKLTKTLDKKDIPQASDKSKEKPKSKADFKNEVEGLLYFRDEINKTMNIIFDNVIGNKSKLTPELKERFIKKVVIAEIYVGLKKAKMWLGVRLGVLRDN